MRGVTWLGTVSQRLMGLLGSDFLEERLGPGKLLSGPGASYKYEGQSLGSQKSCKCWMDMTGSLVISV